jgi:hypothetical protein
MFTKFLPSMEGAVKIGIVLVGALLVLTYVAPSLWAAGLGLQPKPSKLRLVQ